MKGLAGATGAARSKGPLGAAFAIEGQCEELGAAQGKLRARLSLRTPKETAV